MSKFKEGQIVRSTGNPDYTYQILELLGDGQLLVRAHTHIKSGKPSTDVMKHEAPASVFYSEDNQ